MARHLLNMWLLSERKDMLSGGQHRGRARNVWGPEMEWRGSSQKPLKKQWREKKKKERRNKSNHLYVLHIIYSLLFNLCSVWCLPFGWNNSGFLGWRGILISIRIIPGFQGADTELRQDYGAAGRMVLPFPQHHTESQNQWEWNWAWICLWSSSQPSFCAQTPMADADIVPECPLMSQGASPSPEVRYRAVPTRQKVTLHCLGWT